MIDTGSCDSHGFELVESKDECEEAAKFLNLEDTTAHASQTSGRPHGCIYASNNWLSWYSPLAPSAFYSPPAPCGVDFGSAGPYGNHEMIFSCICRTGICDNIFPHFLTGLVFNRDYHKSGTNCYSFHFR